DLAPRRFHLIVQLCLDRLVDQRGQAPLGNLRGYVDDANFSVLLPFRLRGSTELRGPVERGRDRQLGGLGEVRRNQDPAEWERYRPAHDEAGNLAGSNQTVRRRSQDAVADRPAAVWPDH